MTAYLSYNILLKVGLHMAASEKKKKEPKAKLPNVKKEKVKKIREKKQKRKLALKLPCRIS